MHSKKMLLRLDESIKEDSKIFIMNKGNIKIRSLKMILTLL